MSHSKEASASFIFARKTVSFLKGDDQNGTFHNSGDDHFYTGGVCHRNAGDRRIGIHCGVF